MVQIVDFLLAIVPMLVVFVGLVFFRRGGTLMGFVGWLLTLIIAVLFFKTSIEIGIYASFAGILASFGISLMVLFTILQVTMMDLTGAIKTITEFIKTIAAERYEQVMLLNVGLGTFLVSIGATPVTMLPPIMIALGFPALAAIALPALGYDPLTSFSLLAVPIKSPSDTFGLNANLIAQNVALFLPVVSTGLSLGMLWVADGWNGVKKGFVPAILAGLTLGLSAIAFVNLFPSYLQLTGVISGLAAIVVLLLYRVVQGKPIFVKKEAAAKKPTAADGGAVAPAMPLWRALSPWILLVAFCFIISPPDINNWLLNLLGNTQKIHVVGDQYVNLKLLTQAYVWVLVSTVISAPLLLRSRAEVTKTLKVWIRRAWSPTVAAAIFFAIAYVMFWSAKAVDANNKLSAIDATMNMNYVIGIALATYLGAFIFPIVSPLLGLFGGFVSGSETSSNVMFYKILETATKNLNTTLSGGLTKVFAAHAVAGGIASGIAVAKIVNAAAVIDKIGMEGEVIRKSAPVIIVLTLLVGVMLALWLAFF